MIDDEKAILLLGPRQAGKATLLHHMSINLGSSIRWFNGDEPDHRIQLSNRTSSELKALICDNSPFLNEGKSILIEEFGKEYHLTQPVRFLFQSDPLF